MNSRSLCAGPVDGLLPGQCRIIPAGGGSIGLFNVDGRYYALRNYCPHEGAEVCRGKRTGTNLATDQCGEYRWGHHGMVLRCPWHGWEFDLETGRSFFDEKVRVRTYPVHVREGQLWIELSSLEKNL